MKLQFLLPVVMMVTAWASCDTQPSEEDPDWADSLEHADSLSSTESDGQTYPGNTGVDTTHTKVLPNTSGDPRQNSYKGDADTSSIKNLDDTGGYRK